MKTYECPACSRGFVYRSGGACPRCQHRLYFEGEVISEAGSLYVGGEWIPTDLMQRIEAARLRGDGTLSKALAVHVLGVDQAALEEMGLADAPDLHFQ